MTQYETRKTDAIQALHLDAKAYPGGIAALAERIGRSPGVLHNKFSDADDRYSITDAEADALAKAVFEKTGSRAYIEAKCPIHGGIFVALPEKGEAADDDVFAAFLRGMRSLGVLAEELTEARADGVITPDEFAAINLRARKHIATIVEALKTLETQVHDIEQPPVPVTLRSATR
ncbi:MAG: hypothetical protein QM639_04390 [Rhodocyclaceae bacterium]